MMNRQIRVGKIIDTVKCIYVVSLIDRLDSVCALSSVWQCLFSRYVYCCWPTTISLFGLRPSWRWTYCVNKGLLMLLSFNQNELDHLRTQNLLKFLVKL